MRKNCSKLVIENFHEPCILFLLMQKPGYGYEIMENLRDRCCCSVNVGNLYRCLAAMQKNGYLIKQSAAKSGNKGQKPGPERKLYKISAKGLKLLAGWMKELEAGSKTINKLIINYKKHYAANIAK